MTKTSFPSARIGLSKSKPNSVILSTKSQLRPVMRLQTVNIFQETTPLTIHIISIFFKIKIGRNTISFDKQ